MDTAHPSSSAHGGQQARHFAIAELVMQEGPVTIDTLVNRFNVSIMTIYRDLATLEEAGLVQRDRGRVSAVASGLHEASAVFRLEQASDMKALIAESAAAHIPSRSSLLVDDSTSSVFVVRALRNKTPITLLSNSLLVANEASSISGMSLFLLGGTYQNWASATIGPTTVNQIATLEADFCILSASGIANGHVYHPYEDVVEVKRAMLLAASHKILLLDHSKMTRRALHSFAALDEFDLVIVDPETTPDHINQLKDWGANVEVAKPAS